MSIPALVRFRIRAGLRGRVLLAPLVTLAAVELVVLSGPVGPAAVQLVTSVSIAFPVLGWSARQLLDAEPDEQALLSALAVGGRRRAGLAAIAATYAVTAPLTLLVAAGSLLRVEEAVVPTGVAVAGLGFALAVALAAVAVGSLAARSLAGTGGASVVVLVAAPLLVAVVGLSDRPAVNALVPALVGVVRSANQGGFPHSTVGLIAQIALWAAAVLALRWLILRR